MKSIRTAIFIVSCFLFFSLLSIAQNPSTLHKIPSGVLEFEKSKFCLKYRSCILDTIEPMRLNGRITYYFYNYVLYNEKSQVPTQFGIRLTPDGKRDSPYMILRWFPVRKINDIDFVAARDYLNFLLADQQEAKGFDAISFIKTFAISQLESNNGNTNNIPNSQELKVGNFRFHCTFTRGIPPRYPQLTLLIETKN